jgi:hypothetical protein
MKWLSFVRWPLALTEPEQHLAAKAGADHAESVTRRAEQFAALLDVSLTHVTGMRING